jgi:hypothetical protein
MRKEDKFIFAISRAILNKEDSDFIGNLLKEKLDWSYILERSKREAVSPFIYYHLNNAHYNDAVPRSIWEEFKAIYYNNSLRNTILCEEAKRILIIFNEENIKAIILKGIFLAQNIYKNIALRPMSDIDLLIKKEDLARANTILTSLGYASPPNYTDYLKKDLIASINTLLYNKNHASTFFIHLHWHLINSTWPLDSLVSKMDMERIWAYAKPIQLDSINALILSPEHYLLYLAHHSFNHSFDRFILFSDILEFLRCYKDRIDWKVLSEEAKRFNLSRILYYSLFLASKRLRYDIPELEKMKAVKISSLEKVLFSLMNKEIGLSLSAYLMYLLTQDGLAGKLKFIKRTILPTTYVMAHNFSLPISEIKAYHYYRRIVNNLLS